MSILRNTSSSIMGATSTVKIKVISNASFESIAFARLFSALIKGSVFKTEESACPKRLPMIDSVYNAGMMTENCQSGILRFLGGAAFVRRKKRQRKGKATPYSTADEKTKEKNVF